MQIRIQAQPNLDAFSRRIGQLSETLIDDFDWASLAPIVAEAALDIFASEGRGRWPQLSTAYARWKAKNYPGKGILERTGVYLDAATLIGSRNNFVEVGRDYITYGVEGLEYLVFHETGTDRLPARPVFELLEEDEELAASVVEAFSEHINQKLSETHSR